MSIQRIIGMVLVVIGLIALLSGGITWTQRKTVVAGGPVEITTTEHRRLPLSPIVGIIALVGGIALMLPFQRHA
jgi:uncharacterized membrane protein YidH (DUF202 family)